MHTITTDWHIDAPTTYRLEVQYLPAGWLDGTEEEGRRLVLREQSDGRNLLFVTLDSSGRSWWEPLPPETYRAPAIRFGTRRRYAADLATVRRVIGLLGLALDEGERALLNVLESYQPSRIAA